MLSLRIANRYLFSRKSHSIINIISAVSAVAIAVPVMAMVVILSFHNGLSDYIQGLYQDFDPPIRITSSTGRNFTPDSLPTDKIRALTEVESLSVMIEENVLLRHDGSEHLATLRGVDSNYKDVVPVENRLVHGKYTIHFPGNEDILIGQGVAYSLGATVSLYSPIEIYAMRADPGTTVFPTRIYRSQRAQPSGIYALDEPNDSRYIFSGIEFARRLLGKSDAISSVEIRLRPDVNADYARQKIQDIAGDSFKVKTRFQQKETVYKVVNQEKWIIYLLLMMVMLIASLSLAGTVVMLITEKRNETDTLMTMGATTPFIRRIFRRQGIIITVAGTAPGIILGVLFALAQQQWGIIKMGGTSFIMQAYPSKVDPADILIIIISVLLLGTVISAVTARSVIKNRKK